MIRVALKGLAGRKLRAVLTALAVVLGVAMVSGTFVLTDTIRQAFDRIFSDVLREHRRRRQRQDRLLIAATRRRATASPRPLLPKVAGAPGRGRGGGCIVTDSGRQADRQGRQGIGAADAPNLGFGLDPNGDQRFNPLKLARGAGRTARRGRDRQGDRGQAALQGRRPDRRPARGPVKQFQLTGDRELGDRLLDRRRDLRGLRPADGAGAVRQGGPARPDLGRGEGGRAHRAARARDQADPAADRPGDDRRRSRRRRTRRTRTRS